MNTTFNWRANATNLLSVEFLEFARKHLNPGGILYYNTTGSQRVQFTGTEVFPNALRIANFIAVSDSTISFDRANWKRILEEYEIDGRRGLRSVESRLIGVVLSDGSRMPQSEQRSIADGPVEATIEDRASLIRRLQGQRLITDDNMGTEWW